MSAYGKCLVYQTVPFGLLISSPLPSEGVLTRRAVNVSISNKPNGWSNYSMRRTRRLHAQGEEASMTGEVTALVEGRLRGARTRADDVVGFVETTIRQREMKPGDRIGTRADLRRQTGVARATINEAIRLLQERQSVSLRPGPGGGLFVAAPNPVVVVGRTLLAVEADPSTVSGAIEMREQLEPLIARHAATHRTRRDIKELRSVANALASALDEPDRFATTMVTLHTRIADISPNPILRTIYVSLYEWVHDVSQVESLATDPPYVAARLKVHSDLVDAIIDGDADAAEAAGIAHAHSERAIDR